MGDLQLGLVGCGRLAERAYVEAIRRARGVRLAALADPEEARRERLANGLPTYSDAPALVAAGAAEAIVVITPAGAHPEAARSASAAGMPVLIEKPPARNADEAAAIVGLEPAPSFSFNRRFEPGMARMRERIPASGELELTIALHHEGGSWPSYQVSDDALLNLGPHLIDLARWLTRSEVRQVRALELSSTVARLELSLGRGRALISCSTAARPEDLVQVRQGRVRLTRSGRSRPRRVLRRLRHPLGAGTLVRSLARQLEAFAGRPRGEPATTPGTAEDGEAVMRAIDAARDSSGSGGAWQPLNEQLPGA